MIRQSAIKYSSVHKKAPPKADEEATWDGDSEMGKADTPEQWRRMCAWVDPDAPENKGSYKLPHHQADGTLVWAGVRAAGNVLQGGRGGVDIPKKDIPEIKEHLAHHYAQFHRKPPWEDESD